MLATTAALLALVAGVQHFAPRVASGTFDADPGARALGIALGAIAWLVWTTARFTSTGARRFVGRVVALGCAVASAVRIAGPDVLVAMDAMLPGRGIEGFRAMASAIVTGLAAAFVYFTSPARR